MNSEQKVEHYEHFKHFEQKNTNNMDLGVISVRYAKALLRGSLALKVEDQVYAEMQALAQSYIKVPALRHTMDNPMLPREQKAQLLKAAAGGKVSDITSRFIDLVLQEDREKAAQFIANSYITLYRQQKNITRGKLTTAVPASDEMIEKMQRMVASRTSGTVEFETEVNPDIIGGFILDYDTFRLDASVAGKLRNVKKALA